MLNRIHHYGITVSDLDEALTLYRDRLGFEVADRYSFDSEAFSRFAGLDGADIDIVMLESDGVHLEIQQYNAPPGGDANEGVTDNDVGAKHVGIEVEDIKARYRDLSDVLEFVSYPQTLETGTTIVYARDADGNVIEFLERAG